MKLTLNILGILGAITTIGLGIPQLIQQLKTKKTGKVNFASFWIFYVGITLWVIYGVFAGPHYWQVFIANFTCSLIYSATMYYLYYYREDKTKALMLKVGMGILVMTLISLGLLIMFALNMQQYIKEGYPDTKTDYIIPILTERDRAIAAIIAPSFTTLAFLPQLITSLKKKDFHGLSPWMPFLFTINNLLWITYFILMPIYKSHYANPTIQIHKAWIEVAPALIWQVVSLTVYILQFSMIFSFNKKQKNCQHKIEYEVKSA